MSKVFSASQIKKWDKYTIDHEPITSFDLMERASSTCIQWLIKKWPDKNQHFAIFCGHGNNGGDGLAIARLLLAEAYHVEVYLTNKKQRSDDNQKNLQLLTAIYPPCIHTFFKEIKIAKETIIIDAIFGTGLNSPLHDEEESMVDFIANTNCTVVSIDIPSGLNADQFHKEQAVIQADYCLTFEQFKKSFLFPETGKYCGQVILMKIQLNEKYKSIESSSIFTIDKNFVNKFYKKRAPFAHKGHAGHALLFVGQSGKMGAAILCTKACSKAGAGLVTVMLPFDERGILQTSTPEAMVAWMHPNDNIPNFEPYDAIALGCGLGMHEITIQRVEEIIETTTLPLILDADALNILAKFPMLLDKLPQNSLLTPHVKEFDRLFGHAENCWERFETQIEMSKKYKLYILLKGKYTCITTPNGEAFFNTTGNEGMAKGGSGDVLTGIIAGLFAQYKDMFIAASMGVYLHGLAGDFAAAEESVEAMIASDIINHLGKAFKASFYNAQ